MTYTNAEKMIKNAPDPGSADGFGRLLRRLGSPEKELKLIKVYGTSGKSSVCALLSAVLSAAGYRVGRLTTPVVHSARESICISEQPISIEFFTYAADCVYKAFCEIKKEQEDGSAFYVGKHDLLFATALTAFSSADCDFAVIEIPTGDASHNLMGDPLISVISTVTDLDDARKICARLDRGSKEIVTAIQPREVHKLIFDKSAEINVRITIPLKNSFIFMSAAPMHMEFTYKGELYSNRCGAFYQANNLVTVVEAAQALKRCGARIIGTDICAAVLGDGIPLHFEIISIMPTIIIDRADTRERRLALIESLKLLKNRDGLAPLIICETDAAEVEADLASFPYTASVTEVHADSLKKQLRTLLSQLDESSVAVIIGSSAYCEAAARLTREILM